MNLKTFKKICYVNKKQLCSSLLCITWEFPPKLLSFERHQVLFCRDNETNKVCKDFHVLIFWISKKSTLSYNQLYIFMYVSERIWKFNKMLDTIHCKLSDQWIKSCYKLGSLEIPSQVSSNQMKLRASRGFKWPFNTCSPLLCLVSFFKS